MKPTISIKIVVALFLGLLGCGEDGHAAFSAENTWGGQLHLLPRSDAPSCEGGVYDANDFCCPDSVSLTIVVRTGVKGQAEIGSLTDSSFKQRVYGENFFYDLFVTRGQLNLFGNPPLIKSVGNLYSRRLSFNWAHYNTELIDLYRVPEQAGEKIFNCHYAGQIDEPN